MQHFLNFFPLSHFGHVSLRPIFGSVRISTRTPLTDLYFGILKLGILSKSMPSEAASVAYSARRLAVFNRGLNFIVSSKPDSMIGGFSSSSMVLILNYLIQPPPVKVQIVFALKLPTLQIALSRY